MSEGKTKSRLPELSRAEFDILRAMWKRGQQTVREVHEQLRTSHGWAYTTTKTMMDRMVAKKLLERVESHGIFLYRPLISRPAGMARWIQFLADRVLETDTDAVVSLFAASKAVTADEVDELERHLAGLKEDEHDRRR
ncbi:MAG: BlaI/MecI/CopY family transcriptional regulator [Acidobacteriota bacterium]